MKQDMNKIMRRLFTVAVLMMISMVTVNFLDKYMGG